MLLTSYIKTAYRNFVKNPFYSFLNTLSLVIGLSTAAIIGLYINHEFSYDSFHSTSDNLYRVATEYEYNGRKINTAKTNGYIPVLLEEQVPGIREAIKMLPLHQMQQSLVFQIEENSFMENDLEGYYADKELFNVLDFEILSGEPSSMLEKPRSIVITKNLALKYFGSHDVVGKFIHIKNISSFPYEVTGVLENLPTNSHLQFDYLISGSSYTGWRRGDYEDPVKNGLLSYVYFTASENVNIEQVSEKLNEITAGIYTQYTNPRFIIQKTADLHFSSPKDFEIAKIGNIYFVYVLIAIAIFILAITVINYIILKTSQSVGRAREIGVRKSLGSNQFQLMLQYLTESVIYVIIAGIVAGMVTEWFYRPVFAVWFDAELSLFDQPVYYLSLLVGSVLIGFLSGMFPAFKLSTFNIVETLKGITPIDRFSTINLRSILVGLQFAITIVLIGGNIIILRQLDYIKNKNLGYSKEQTIIFKPAWLIPPSNWKLFKEQLRNQASTLGVGEIRFGLYESDRQVPIRISNDGLNDTLSVPMVFNPIDEYFIPTMEMELAAGRNFSPDRPEDLNNVIINEAGVRALGLDNDTVLGSRYNSSGTGKVIGIVKDFHFTPFDQSIKPIVLSNISRLEVSRSPIGWRGDILARISTEDISATLKNIEKIWTDAGITIPFSYSFLDDSFSLLIEKETRLGNMITTLTLLTILIAVLGLMGLVSYTAEQRRKEIGVRKVMGASVTDILKRFNMDFLKLVGIASLFAIPVAFWAATNWLSNFAYRIDPQWYDLAITLAVILIITVGTISLQSMRAARANPVNTLKEE